MYVHILLDQTKLLRVNQALPSWNVRSLKITLTVPLNLKWLCTRVSSERITFAKECKISQHFLSYFANFFVKFFENEFSKRGWNILNFARKKICKKHTLYPPCWSYIMRIIFFLLLLKKSWEESFSCWFPGPHFIQSRV